jgi:hypothetical protein
MTPQEQAHAAIERLVAHLERQATEHIHALDALRAENEALRTQNAHLRALQAAQGPVDVNPDKVVRATIMGLVALAEDKAGPRRHAVKHARGWQLYADDDRVVGIEASDDVALGWCQFGWPYAVNTARQANAADAKPAREVVRGYRDGYPCIAEPGRDPTTIVGRTAAILSPTDCSAYIDGYWPTGDHRSYGLTEPEAIAWVLDGVLPTR